MNKAAIILKAKEFAAANYNKGYDTFVECYTDEEWAEFVGNDSWYEVKRNMKQMAEYWNDQRANARAEAGW